MKWALFREPIVEVAPLDDLRDHVRGPDCWCGPTVTLDGILLHTSMDGREAYERGERKAN
jgi:hypothetical protein